MYYNKYLKYKNKYNFLKSSMKKSIKGGSNTIIKPPILREILSNLSMKIQMLINSGWGGDEFTKLITNVNELTNYYESFQTAEIGGDDDPYFRLLLKFIFTLADIINILNDIQTNINYKFTPDISTKINELIQELSSYRTIIINYKNIFKPGK